MWKMMEERDKGISKSAVRPLRARTPSIAGTLSRRSSLTRSKQVSRGAYSVPFGPSPCILLLEEYRVPLSIIYEIATEIGKLVDLIYL